MNLSKIFITGTLSTILSFSALSAHANGLTITNNSNLSNISVQCTGPMPGVPIGKGKTVNLSWMVINRILGGSQGSCSFFSNGVKEADASILINASLSSAIITSYNLYDPKLVVSFSPTIQVSSAKISATISGG